MRGDFGPLGAAIFKQAQHRDELPHTPSRRDRDTPDASSSPLIRPAGTFSRREKDFTMPRHKPVTDKQTARARDLRHDSPFPEKLLWGRLRNRGLSGIKFRRQFPLGPFIIDFYCDDAKVAIELDGDSHAGRADYDADRTKFIEASGLRVVRIGNDDILSNLDGVLEMILRECGRKP